MYYTMACKPYNPAIGKFNDFAWGTTTPNPWSTALITSNNTTPSSSNPADTFQLKKNNVEVSRLRIRNPLTVRWIFFPSQNFLAVRDVVTSGGTDDYKVWIFDLRGSSVTYMEAGGPWGVPITKQLNFHISSDGLAFFMFITDTLLDSTKQHAVFRTDTLAQLCSWGPLTSVPGMRQAWITAERKVQIKVDPPPSGAPTGGVYATCPIPSGKCSVLLSKMLYQGKLVPYAQFPEVVWDGPEAKTQSLSVPIKNTGNDCLQINSVAGVAPSTFSSPTAFPVFIDPGKQTNLILKFTPQGLGPSSDILTITLIASDPESDTQIYCTGTARTSRAESEIIGSDQVLQVVFNTSSSALGAYGIKNKGDDKLKVDSITNSPHFRVVPPLPNYSRLLGHDEQLSVNVEFAPTAATAFTEDLQIACTPPNGATRISCIGSARLPNLGLNAVQPASFTTYLFRRKRVTITLANTGEVPLTIDVTSTSTMFKPTPIGTIPASSSQSFDVYVWSDKMGKFSVPLTIRGTYHLVVKDRNGQSVIDQNLQASCTVTVSGTVIPMPPDVLENNDDFTTAIKVDLPMPAFQGPAVQLGFVDISLDDRNGGQDKDYFAVSYQSSTQDDNSTGGGIVRHTLGIVMQYYPPSLDIQTKARPETRDDGAPFSRTLQIYSSDAYNRKLLATTSGNFHAECPTLKFADKKLYAVMSNPDYSSQGPVEYDILFSYTPFQAILRCGAGLTRVEFVILEKYYDAIWRVDPPWDSAGNRVDVKAWVRGAAIVIRDVKSFLNKHREFMSRPDILEGLQKKLKQQPDAILATEWLGLAQVAQAGGLAGEAEKLYKESADKSSRARRFDMQAEALHGLLRLYVAEEQSAKAMSVEKSLASLLKKSQKR